MPQITRLRQTGTGQNGTVTFRRGRLIPAPDYTSKQTGGRTNPETHWGTRNPPAPKNTARFQVPQTPPTSPKNNDGPRRTHDRGKRGGPRYRPDPMTEEERTGAALRAARAYRPAPADVETAALRAADAYRAAPADRGSLQASRGTPGQRMPLQASTRPARKPDANQPPPSPAPRTPPTPEA
jgi:hypothetical protein